MDKYFKDLGYEIKKHFTGCKKETLNLFFRGEYISTHKNNKEANLAAIFHDDERGLNIL